MVSTEIAPKQQKCRNQTALKYIQWTFKNMLCKLSYGHSFSVAYG